MQEQRQSARIPVRFKLDQFIVRNSTYPSMQGHDVYYEGEAVNLSLGGAGCIVSGAVEPLTQVFLMFALPTGRRISCEGYVAHSHLEGGRCEAGIRFQGLGAEDQGAIAAYLASLP